jgi:hypothetical protein
MPLVSNGQVQHGPSEIGRFPRHREGRPDQGIADMTRRPPAGRGSFRREWNFAFGLLAAAAGLLFAAGYNITGGIAFALCAAGYAARRRAMRKQSLGFYGEQKRPH